MNIFKRIIAFICVLFLVGCSNSSGGVKREKSTKQSGNINTELKEMESEEIPQSFTGLDIEEMKYGNSSDLISHAGKMCVYNNAILSVERNNILTMKSEDKNTVIAENVQGGINCYNDKIFYIDKTDGFIHSKNIKDEQENVELAEKTNELLVGEVGIIYTNTDNKLFIKERNGNTSTISSNICLWLNYYGKWLVYTELMDSDNNPVIAYNIDTKEKRKILNYGLHTTIFDETLFFQNNIGTIEKLDLKSGKASAVTDEWGQSPILIDEELFFMSGGKIYKNNLENKESSLIYSSDKGIIDSMWKLESDIIFIEKDKETEETWKKLNPNTGEVTIYE